MVAWFCAHGCFWAGVVVLAAVAVADRRHAVRHEREERQAMLRRIPVPRKRRAAASPAASAKPGEVRTLGR